jgi:general L-amino acid transport system substrate-binding protein
VFGFFGSEGRLPIPNAVNNREGSMMMNWKIAAASAALAVAVAAPAHAGATLDAVKQRGSVQCGANNGLAGFGIPDDKGNWTGLDVDFCRAIAAAVFGDATKVKFTPLTAKERFTALQSGEVDVLARNTTWTLSRDTGLGFNFIGVNYYDGQGFMVRESLGVKSATELNGASVCVQTGTTTELNLTDYFRTNNMELKSVVFEKADEARTAYDEGRCDAFTTDASGLAAERSVLKNPAEHIILPEIISKEPLGPLVRHGDNEWEDIVRWTLNAMVIAEEFGITQANVDQMKAESQNPEIRRMLGVEGDMGQQLKVNPDWAYQIIKQVGNYGESFERNVGEKTPLRLARGLNQLWSKGGLLYAPPIR